MKRFFLLSLVALSGCCLAGCSAPTPPPVSAPVAPVVAVPIPTMAMVAVPTLAPSAPTPTPVAVPTPTPITILPSDEIRPGIETGVVINDVPRTSPEERRRYRQEALQKARNRPPIQ